MIKIKFQKTVKFAPTRKRFMLPTFLQFLFNSMIFRLAANLTLKLKKYFWGNVLSEWWLEWIVYSACYIKGHPKKWEKREREKMKVN